MTHFKIQHLAKYPDRIVVEIDRRFEIVIQRISIGLELRVYPRTDGELWDEPFEAFEIDEDEIIALEQELSQ